ncbi:MAG: DNA adenine methylase [Spirochaetaceae bacterium]|nr:DNA adenine methylase [Spirochaetaceae bacterium]
MSVQAALFSMDSCVLTSQKQTNIQSAPARYELFDALYENKDYLTKQIITYIGNKRSLLQFITQGIKIVQERLGKKKLGMFDVFSGSGIVARLFKQYSSLLLVNDLENYSKITNECYLSNKSELNIPFLKSIHHDLLAEIENKSLLSMIIANMYAPKDDNNIKAGERVFYTRRNAQYIDTMRHLIERIDANYQKYFLAPLISEASIHSNTSGVFKGFYKNHETGIGQFGGERKDALLRIKGDIVLPFPVFSNFDSEYTVFSGDANVVINTAPEVDLAYLDPPYNQHPYGSNYFMLNLILENTCPENSSMVSGIPENWNRSAYNKKQFASKALTDLVANIKSKFVLISFNSEGFISLDEMKDMLYKIGKLEILEVTYNTFRGCRNLANRNIHVKEYLYLLEK